MKKPRKDPISKKKIENDVESLEKSENPAPPLVPFMSCS